MDQSSKDVIRGIRYYFLLPLIILAISSMLHEYFASIGAYSGTITNDQNDNNSIICSSNTGQIVSSCTNFNNDDLHLDNNKVSYFMIWVLQSRMLILGFPTRQKMIHQMYESLLGACCWGYCFLFIRKRFNPENKRNYFQRYWRGTIFAMLSIFYGGMLRSIVKRSIFPLTRYCHCLNTILSWLFPEFWSSITLHCEKDIMCTAVYNAFIVGICWGVGNTCVRRRLDPAMRNPPETFIQRHWKDVCCGTLAMATSSFVKSMWKHYMPAGIVEDILANMLGSFSADSTLIPSISALVFDCQNDYECYHHIHEAIKVGISWGLTSLFIRKGLNSDIRNGGNFVCKYWRDALYGTIAMMCCSLLKTAVRIWLGKIAFYVMTNQTGISEEL